jgi:glycosyltransferase involved in cell wall biosynthesis
MSENSNPLISIIVPCFNQAEYLDECLQSITNQTYQNWECIIVNDGSPDNTEEVASIWISKDVRFKYLYKENGGLSSARNAGIEKAEGEWIQFLDCDDYLHQDKFSASLNDADFNTSLIVTNFNLLYPDKLTRKAFCDISKYEISFEVILSRWDIDFNIPIHCALFTKKSIGDLKFDEFLKSKEDWVFWLNYLDCPRVIKYLKRELVTYRVNPNSVGIDPYLNEIANQFLFERLSNVNQKILFKKINYQLLITQQELRKCSYEVNNIELPKVLKYYMKIRSFFL